LRTISGVLPLNTSIFKVVFGTGSVTWEAESLAKQGIQESAAELD
jgi:hypothetical protein